MVTKFCSFSVLNPGRFFYHLNLKCCLDDFTYFKPKPSLGGATTQGPQITYTYVKMQSIYSYFATINLTRCFIWLLRIALSIGLNPGVFLRLSRSLSSITADCCLHRSRSMLHVMRCISGQGQPAIYELHHEKT